MGDISFGSSVTNDGSANDLSETVAGYRTPDFTIFRYLFELSTQRAPPLPSALVENKPLELDDILGTLKSPEKKDTASSVLVIMDRTTAQAREQLECLFEEYPLSPGEPDPLPKVYHFIIAGGWYRMHEVTRDNWHQLSESGNPTYIFEGESINRGLMEFWPNLRFQGFS